MRPRFSSRKGRGSDVGCKHLFKSLLSGPWGLYPGAGVPGHVATRYQAEEAVCCVPSGSTIRRARRPRAGPALSAPLASACRSVPLSVAILAGASSAPGFITDAVTPPGPSCLPALTCPPSPARAHLPPSPAAPPADQRVPALGAGGRPRRAAAGPAGLAHAAALPVSQRGRRRRLADPRVLLEPRPDGQPVAHAGPGRVRTLLFPHHGLRRPCGHVGTRVPGGRVARGALCAGSRVAVRGWPVSCCVGCGGSRLETSTVTECPGHRRVDGEPASSKAMGAGRAPTPGPGPGQQGGSARRAYGRDSLGRKARRGRGEELGRQSPKEAVWPGPGLAGQGGRSEPCLRPEQHPAQRNHVRFSSWSPPGPRLQPGGQRADLGGVCPHGPSSGPFQGPQLLSRGAGLDTF